MMYYNEQKQKLIDQSLASRDISKLLEIILDSNDKV
jgi:hypothetical protein